MQDAVKILISVPFLVLKQDSRLFISWLFLQVSGSKEAALASYQLSTDR